MVCYCLMNFSLYREFRYIAIVNLDTEYKGVHLTLGILVGRMGK
jgi:hypothetical protein